MEEKPSTVDRVLTIFRCIADSTAADADADAAPAAAASAVLPPHTLGLGSVYAQAHRAVVGHAPAGSLVFVDRLMGNLRDQQQRAGNAQAQGGAQGGHLLNKILAAASEAEKQQTSDSSHSPAALAALMPLDAHGVMLPRPSRLSGLTLDDLLRAVADLVAHALLRRGKTRGVGAADRVSDWKVSCALELGEVRKIAQSVHVDFDAYFDSA
jgi:hypothetical protein